MIASWVSIFKSWILSKPLKRDCGGHGQKTGHICLFLQWCDVAQIAFLLQPRLMSFQIGLPPAGASGLVTNRMLHSLMGSHSLLQSSQPGFHACFFVPPFHFFVVCCKSGFSLLTRVTVLHICFSSEMRFEFMFYCEMLRVLKRHGEIASTNSRCVVLWSGHMV